MPDPEWKLSRRWGASP